MAAGVRGLYTRFSTEFLERDPRFVGRSDAAQSMFCWLVSRVLSSHREFLLPEDSDVRSIATRRARRPGLVRKALEELASGMPRPLIGFFPDNGVVRIRVMGQRAKHGNAIAWRDERNSVGTWNEANPADPLTPEDYAEVVVSGRPAKRTSNDPETVVTYPDPEADTTPPPTPPARGGATTDGTAGLVHQHEEATTGTAALGSPPPSQVSTAGVGHPPGGGNGNGGAGLSPAILFRDITRDWPGEPSKGLNARIHARLSDDYDRAVHAIAHALGVDRCRGPGGIRSPWGALSRRLREPGPGKQAIKVGDADVAAAKRRLGA